MDVPQNSCNADSSLCDSVSDILSNLAISQQTKRSRSELKKIYDENENEHEEEEDEYELQPPSKVFKPISPIASIQTPSTSGYRYHELRIKPRSISKTRTSIKHLTRLRVGRPEKMFMSRITQESSDADEQQHIWSTMRIPLVMFADSDSENDDNEEQEFDENKENKPLNEQIHYRNNKPV